jgi:glyoxalase family protein
MDIQGIHHITAISSDAQKTYDFYSKVLGLRLVKKSVNQDDVETYHLFFGNKTGTPGFDLTFFPFKGVPKGKRGAGQVTKISFAVPAGSLNFWVKRFSDLQIKHDDQIEHSGFKRLTFYDFDDQRLELVEVSAIEDQYETNVWTTNEVSKEHALRCFHGATMAVISEDLIKPVLELLGFKKEVTESQHYLYKIPERTNCAFLEVEELPLEFEVVNGAGTVHHIAFAVADDATELKVHDALITIGLRPTHVINRFYFKSVYFMTPAGILCEIATDEPGFAADEDINTLGEKLALPPFIEDQRAHIESILPPLKT